MSMNATVERHGQMAMPDGPASATAIAAEPADPSLACAEIVTSIFARVLGCGSVGWDDDFFDLGGDSILAVMVMLEVEKATGQALPLTTIFDASTPRMIGLLLSGKARPRGSSLVLLKPGLETTPVFIVHGLGGSVMELRALARAIDTTHAVYGVQARGMDGAEPPLDRVEAMASCYAEEIRRIQSSGPYYLVGFSFGGLVALELAKLLSGAGQEIALLAMLDTFTHTSHWSLRCRLASYYKLLQLQASFTVWARAGRHYFSTVRQMPLRQAVPYVISRAGRAMRFPFDILRFGAVLHRFIEENEAVAAPRSPEPHILPPDLQRVMSAGRDAFHHYRPHFFAGEIVFVKAEHAVRVPFDAKLLWGKYASKLTIHNVPGDHLGLVNGDVDSLATVLSSSIREAAARRPSVELEMAP